MGDARHSGALGLGCDNQLITLTVTIIVKFEYLVGSGYYIVLLTKLTIEQLIFVVSKDSHD